MLHRGYIVLFSRSSRIFKVSRFQSLPKTRSPWLSRQYGVRKPRTYPVDSVLINDRRERWLQTQPANYQHFLFGVHNAGRDFDLDSLSAKHAMSSEKVFELAKRVNELFNDQWSKVVCSRIFYSLAETSTGLTHVAANVYVVKMSLQALGNLSNQFLRDAVKRVKVFADEGHFEAQVIYAQKGFAAGSLDFGEIRELFDKASGISSRTYEKQTPKSLRVVTKADFELAYARFLQEASGPEGESEEDTLKRADDLVKSAAASGHFGACIEVARPPADGDDQLYDWAYHDSLVKLAISGDLAAAKRLGDIYSLDDEWQRLAPDIKAYVEQPEKLAMEGLLAPAPYRNASAMSGSDRVFRPYLTSYYLWKWQNNASYDYTGVGLDEHGKLDLAHMNSKRRFELTFRHLRRLEEAVKQRKVLSQTRLHKALDWYKFAACGGHVPAQAAGCVLAIRLYLPMDEKMFRELWHRDHGRTDKALPREKVWGSKRNNKDWEVFDYDGWHTWDSIWRMAQAQKVDAQKKFEAGKKIPVEARDRPDVNVWKQIAHGS